jgi:hypothetical protein
VIKDQDGRGVIHCDRCTIRMDLGPAAIVLRRIRIPSGWLQDAPDHHLCPVCSSRAVEEQIRARKLADA